MDVKLRDYQIKGIDDIIEAWKECRSILFQMPTGTGKTTLFCEIVRKFITEFFPDKKVLIITHRKELVEQAFDRLVSDFHLTSGIIAASYIGIQSAQIQVASIQTLDRRKQHQEDIFSLVVIDESHHALASTYKKLWNYYPSSKFLGVTATPIRTDGEGFEDLFERLVKSESIKWFIKNKYLADTRYFASHSPDLSNVRMREGDYDSTELSEIMQNNNIMADLVQSYIDFANDKKVIVFAVNRAHSTKIVEKYNSFGIPAMSIDTYTQTEERIKIVNDFRNNKFKVLVNVNIFTEGFDCPDIDGVQLARPTRSLTLFIQQVGRCMRPYQGKLYGIILDNAGLWKEHGLPKMEREWALTGNDDNICPSRKNIVGLNENSQNGRRQLVESKSLRLLELGELDNETTLKTISYDKIEKSLTNNKILTMRERIEFLINRIEKFEQKKASETDEEFRTLLNDSIKEAQKELAELQENLKPRRLESVFDLILERCQEIIDNNDIFIEGDKDLFLKSFIEPSFKLNPNTEGSGTKSSKTKKEALKTSVKEGDQSKISYEYDSIEEKKIPNIEGQIEVFHYFQKHKKEVKAMFEPSTEKLIYKNDEYKSPSGAAIKATKDIDGINTHINGWIWWKYIDANGIEKIIDSFRKK